MYKIEFKKIGDTCTWVVGGFFWGGGGGVVWGLFCSYTILIVTACGFVVFCFVKPCLYTRSLHRGVSFIT